MLVSTASITVVDFGLNNVFPSKEVRQLWNRLFKTFFIPSTMLESKPFLRRTLSRRENTYVLQSLIVFYLKFMFKQQVFFNYHFQIMFTVSTQYEFGYCMVNVAVLQWCTVITRNHSLKAFNQPLGFAFGWGGGRLNEGGVKFFLNWQFGR